MNRKFLLCFACVILLGLASGCSRLTGRNDEAITTDLKAKMFSEPDLKSANLNVTTKDGVVTLTGEVPDDTARLAAYKLASEEKGVAKVNDEMTIASAQASAPPAMAEPAPAPRAAPARPRHSARYPAPPAPASTTEPASPAPAAAPSEPAAQPAPPAAPAPPRPINVTVPSGTVVTVRTIDAIDSSKNHAGEIFRASLDAPIVVDDKVIVPAGADAYLKLASASSAGHMTGRSELAVELSSVVFQGKTYNLVSSDVKQSGSSRGKNTAAKVGGGAALGALIGAIAGGGKGAAIGAAVGGGAGAGAQVLTKGQQVKIPSETRLDFTLEQPFDVTYVPGRKSTRQRADRPPSSDQPSDQPPSLR